MRDTHATIKKKKTTVIWEAPDAIIAMKRGIKKNAKFWIEFITP
jgi:hypothetical protein